MRDNIFLIGANHTRTPISFRERLSLSSDEQQQSLANRPSECTELAILSTCNRTEFYAVVPGSRVGQRSITAWASAVTGVAEEDLATATYALTGRDAIAHLFNVSAGLDSMVLGEPHILGQVRSAFELAMSATAAGPILSRLGQDAVHVGKQVRTRTGLARNRQSIPHVAVDLALKHLHRPIQKAVVIGAGDMGTLSAKVLRSTGVVDLVVMNRDETKGIALSHALSARFAPFNRLMQEIAGAKLVISAIDVDGFIIGPTDVDSHVGPVTFVDLGVPRSIDPKLRVVPGVHLLDIDDLQHGSVETRELAACEVAIAERIVESACGEFLQWWAARESAPAIASLTRRADQIRTAELERALRKLDHLSDRDRNVVAALSVGIVNKLLHQPISTLRGSLDSGETADSVRKLFGLEPSNRELGGIRADARSTTSPGQTAD